MRTEVSLPGLDVVEHTFEVPLDHADPAGAKITVFARELADPSGHDRPYLVYLQGGPGFEAPRPTRAPNGPGWLDRALSSFRVLMLDQRGTGRSTPIGSLPGKTPQEQADYLALHRADAIVRDAEWIRRELGVQRWSVLGQSFGGMCVTTYLSIAPEGLTEAFITGGLPPLRRHIDEVYTATYERLLERNRQYVKRYPQDVRRLEELRVLTDDGGIELPGGDRLTWARFRQLGATLGFSDGAEQMHYLLELPFDSPGFRHDVERAGEFARNPIYAVLHEASWADGGTTRWSADRLLPEIFESEPLFTGEHIGRWAFDDYVALAPLREAAELLAQRDWPHLYDPDALAANQVPVAAAIYAQDMFVERVFSEETAGRIAGARTWLTNEYEHNGLRADGARILGRLIDLARGRA
jgi:pimeloyl-ACP methyl ester carboxylesterase